MYRYIYLFIANVFHIFVFTYISNLLYLFQCAPAVVHRVFRMVASIQDRVHTTVVLSWITFVTKDSFCKATVELLVTRIVNGDLLRPAKEASNIILKLYYVFLVCPVSPVSN